jgi:plastocyanin
MAELFYPLGIGLTLLAVVVSFLGLRNKDFPGSKAALAGGIAVFAVLVFATMATGVKNAQEEQDHRENEQAEEAAHEAELEAEAEQAEDVGQAEGGAAGEQLQQEAGGKSGGTVELSAPEDGSLAFEPESLEAPAGEVTVAFTNPAAIDHDVHIERDGEEVAASDVVADGETTEASAELDPGDYAYYCAIPGHREGGMEGTLTVE